MYFGLTESKYEIKRLLPISLETRLHIETYKVRSLHSCYEVKGDDLRYRYSDTFSKFWLRELVVYQITNVMTLRVNVPWDINYVKIMISISHCIKPNEPRIYGVFDYFCTIKTDYRSSHVNLCIFSLSLSMFGQKIIDGMQKYIFHFVLLLCLKLLVLHKLKTGQQHVYCVHAWISLLRLMLSGTMKRIAIGWLFLKAIETGHGMGSLVA